MCARRAARVLLAQAARGADRHRDRARRRADVRAPTSSPTRSTSRSRRSSQTGERGRDVVVVPHQALGANADVQTGVIGAATLARVRAVPGVAVAAGEVFSVATLFDAARQAAQHARAELRRVDAAGALRELLDRARARCRAGAGDVAIDQATAQRYSLRVGQTLRVAGAATAAALPHLRDRQVRRQRLVRRRRRRAPHPRRRRSASPASPAASTRSSSPRSRASAAATLRARIRAVLPRTLDVRTGTQEAAQQTSDLESQLGFLRTFLLIFAYVALFVGAFIIFNTFSITVAQRTREFGLLRTLGATRAQIARLGRRRGRDARPRRSGDRPRRGTRRSRPRSTSSSRRSAPTFPTAARCVEFRTVWVSLLAGHRGHGDRRAAPGDPRLARHADRGAARGRLAARAGSAQPAPAPDRARRSWSVLVVVRVVARGLVGRRHRDDRDHRRDHRRGPRAAGAPADPPRLVGADRRPRARARGAVLAGAASPAGSRATTRSATPAAPR